jgi:hypothetical protein
MSLLSRTLPIPPSATIRLSHALSVQSQHGGLDLAAFRLTHAGIAGASGGEHVPHVRPERRRPDGRQSNGR